MWKYIFLLIIIILWIIYFLLLKMQKKVKKKLWVDKIKKYKKILEKLWKKTDSYDYKIVQYDKLYHNILLDIWYNWTFWEILKWVPKEINDINLIWKIHKIRNQIVHDFEHIDKKLLKKHCITYKKEVENLFYSLV